MADLPRFRAGTTMRKRMDVVDPPGRPRTTFKIRQVGYAKTGHKAPSEEPMFVNFGCDVVETSSKLKHIARWVDLPPLPEHMQEPANGVPSYFIVHASVPMYEPSVFSSRDDGPSFSFMAYFVMTPETRAHLLDPATAPPGVRLFKDFIDDDSKESRERFKFMLWALNMEDLGVGGVTRKLVTDYNGKPVMSRPQHSFYTDNRTYFEVTIDMHTFGIVARKTLNGFKNILHALAVDGGFVVQGNTDDQLPELMMGVARCSMFPNKEHRCVNWEDHAAQDAEDRAEEERHRQQQLAAAKARG